VTPVFQRIVDPEHGDCHRAAVASLLDLALDDVPEDLQTGFAHERFLAELGLCAVHLETHRLKPHSHPEMLNGKPWDARNLVRFDYAAGAHALASVPSQRFPGGWHAIVVRFAMQPEGWVRVECAHDPNPGNAPYDMERTEIRALTFFLPRWAPVEARPA
jgi:hypothetical protein